MLPNFIKENDKLKGYDKLLFVLAFAFAYLFFSHPDLWETANHSYVFLESLFSGHFRDFYSICAQHNNTYYYINNANYNIVIYIIFGIWELSIFIINQLLHMPMNEQFMIMWAKAVPVAFYIGCGIMFNRLCKELDMDNVKASTATLFFLFNPISFFSPMIMGQYDTLCLFFMLWALTYYIKKDMNRFSFIIGLGAVCKFFPLLIFVPLVLLAEKRIFHILKYGAISLWLYIPTTLIFWGRTGDAKVFTQAMIDRMFLLTISTGTRGVSVFTLVYALVVFACFMYGGSKKDDKIYKYMSVYIPLVCFGALFNSIYWHPQWLVLIVPFIVATTFMQKQGNVAWFYLDVVLAFGFFINSFYLFPNQIECVLFSGGIMTYIFNVNIAAATYNKVNFYLNLVPYLATISPVAFAGSILANILFKLPLNGQTISDKLFTNDGYDNFPLKLYGYGIFVVGLGCIWFLPTLFEYLKALAVI